MKKITNLRWLILSLLLAVGVSAWGQTTLLSEDFSALTTGSNTSTSGSNTVWSGNDNFPTVNTAYPAAGAIKFGTGNKSGSITSKSLTVEAGTLTVTFDVKGWTSVEGNIKITAGSQNQAVSYTAKITDSFESKSVDFTILDGGSMTVKIETTAKRAFVDNVVITNTPSGGNPTVATPTFSPAAGAVLAGTEVSINCTTEGATIHYTTNGSTPTTSSAIYSEPIVINSAQTLKAIAVKNDYDNSEIATAAYTITTPYTVAEARAAIDAGTGTTGVYVTGIVSQIVTAYNSQYGNISYNISTDGTTTSDQLQAYRGKSYNGDNFTSSNDIQVGDVVVIYGDLTKYGDTYELAQNNQLVSLNRSEKQDAGLAYTPTTVTLTQGDALTQPSLANPNNLTVTYSSDNEDVATVVSDGTITLAGATGTAVITAHSDATSTYNAGNATFTITVNAAASTNELVTVDSEGNVTFLFNDTGWGLPEGSNNKIVTATQYTNSGYTITVAGSSGNGFYYNENGYLLMGKSGAYLTLPAFSFDVERIEVTGTSGASETVTQNIYVGETAVSTETTGAKNKTNEYAIADAYQAAGNVYTLKVTSNANTQFTQIKVYKKSNTPSLSFTNNKVTVYVGATATQTANSYNIGNNTISYSTGDYNIATVNAGTGEVTGVAAGETTITASVTVNGTTYTASYTVEVKKNDAGISYSQTSFQIEQGSTFTAPTLNNPNNLPVTYSSDNDAVATVDPTTGAVTLVGGTGLVTITATFAGNDTFNAGTASYTLRVRSEETGGSGDYEKITSITDLTDGDYLIVWEDAESAEPSPVAFDGGLTTLDAASNNISVTISDNKVVSTPEVNAAIFTITAIDGGYSIKSASGYYIGSTDNGSNNELKSSTSTVYTNTITFDSNNAIIRGTNNYLQYNSASNNNRFRYFKTQNQQPIALYKRTQGALTVKTPIISPETGTYTTRPQTVTITCATEGATIFYTLDGTNPTSSSTQYTGPFTINSNKTIKAIAYLGTETSRVAEETISFTVNPPVFSPASGSFDSAYDIEITADPGLTIFFITQDNKIYKSATGMTATKSEASVDANGNPILVSTAQNYSGALTFSQSIMITAVAVDADGVQSDPVTVQYTHTGAVSTPYYSQFSASAGDFTITNVASGSEAAPEWKMNSNTGQTAIDNWGEERYYMMVKGTSGNTNESRTRYYGTAYLTSPIIDLTDKTDASFSFIHAGHHFYADPNTSSTTTDNSLERTLSDAKAKAACRVEVGISDASGNVTTWTDISDDVNYFTQKFNTNRVDTESGSNDQVISSSYTGTSRSGNFPRANSGDISLASYAGNYIRIRFAYTSTSSNYGTWNVDKVTVNASKTEKITLNSKGWTTYVIDHDIDAYATTQNYISGGEETLKIYKVTEFDKTNVVLQQLGKFENPTDANNSERYLHSKTPVVIEGPADQEINFVVYNPASELPLVKNNLLYASLSPNLVTATEDTRYYVLQWKSATNEPIFNRLKTGREVPDHKAYLNGVDEIEQVSVTPNPVKGIYVLGGDDEGEATGITEVDKAQEILKNGVIYNLAGQRVVNPTKGLYIVNGKKVYLK